MKGVHKSVANRARLNGEPAAHRQSIMGLVDKAKRFSNSLSGNSETDITDSMSTPSSSTSHPRPTKAVSRTRAAQPSPAAPPSPPSPPLPTITFDRRSRARFFYLITSTELPLELAPISDDTRSRLALLCFNGIAVELRDLFRILDGLHHRAEQHALAIDHIFAFYDWFEGFYGIVTCIFDAEEDVLFSWLEKVGALKMENALAPKRRKTKKERTKDLCWDILELKMQFEKKASRKVSLTSLVLEMRDEAEQLTSRLLMYMQTLLDELPDLLDQNFGFDERKLIEEAVINNFRATEPGKFVIMAYARGIVDDEKRAGFLEESLRNPKSARSPVAKQQKRYDKKHVQLAEDLAIEELVLTTPTTAQTE